MARFALLAHPRSTGNRSMLPEVRSFCPEQKDMFHYEVEHVDQIGTALKTIARVKPEVLVINGGDGTVQAALTELHHGGHFGGTHYKNGPPPVAVLPNGKTNLIALALGASGDCRGAGRRSAVGVRRARTRDPIRRSAEHTTELQPLMRNQYDVLCMKK